MVLGLSRAGLGKEKFLRNLLIFLWLIVLALILITLFWIFYLGWFDFGVSGISCDDFKESISVVRACHLNENEV